MTKSLRQQTILGMTWSAVQKFGTVIIGFIANLFLARLLTPTDFGAIGMLMVFIALSDTLVDGGFGSALIQRQNPTDTDYSTVFFWNIIMAILLYAILFISSPLIASFYNIPTLNNLLKVLGIVLLINSFNIIQSSILIKLLKFKILAKRDIISTIMGALVGIILAYRGFGVWSLVAYYLVAGVMKSILLWTTCKWRPQLVFSWVSFKGLFRFGSFIFLSSLTEKLFSNIQTLIIGKVFSASTLGYYTQASKLENAPASSLSAIVNQVTYPVFSTLQDDFIRLRNAIRNNLKAIVFLNFPLMILLIVIARPLVILLFTEKWEPSIPIFQILCLAAIFHFSNTINTNIIKSIGLSQLFFKVQILKRVIALIILIIGLQFGFMGMIWGIVIYNYIYFFINAYISGKIINYGILKQIKDSGSELIISIVSGISTYFIFTYIQTSLLLQLISQILVFITFYILLSYAFKIDGLFIYKEITHDLIKTKLKK